MECGIAECMLKDSDILFGRTKGLNTRGYERSFDRKEKMDESVFRIVMI